jgi:imidazolonepropionase-like amidohydrolase
MIHKTFACSALIGAILIATPAPARHRLVDGVSRTPRDRNSTLIRGDLITGVQSGFVTPAGAQVIDLSKQTLLPGLVVSHVHITSQFDDGNPLAEHVTETSYEAAVIQSLCRFLSPRERLNQCAVAVLEFAT